MEQEDQCHVVGEPREPIFDGEFSFNTGKLRSFTGVDYFFFASTFGISTMIGFYQAWYNRQKMGIEEYLLAGRAMNGLPVSFSLLASFMSAITLLGAPSEVYNYTTIYVWIGVGYFLCVAATAEIYMPVFYQLKITSAYEYLEYRFNRKVRMAAAGMFVVQISVYTSIVLYAPSVALHSVTGLNLWGSIISVAAVGTAYTAIGGMRAVVWTDSFQISLAILTLMLLCVKASMTVGSWNDVWESARRTNRVLFSDWSLNPSVRHSVWGLTIGGFGTWLATYMNQTQIHRCLACRTLKQAKLAMWLNFPGLCIILYLCCFIGLYMSAFYENCDPVQANFVNGTIQIVPLFVMDILGDTAGLSGVFVAGLFSASLSTISSGLNSVSAVILEDFIRLNEKTNIREKRARFITQVIAVLFGTICLELAFLASQFKDILQASLSTQGILGAPVVGVFSLGMFFPWANARGALVGLFGTMFFMAWLFLGKMVANIPSLPTSVRCVSNCNLTAFNNYNSSATSGLGHYITPTPVDIRSTSTLHTMSYLWYSTSAVVVCIVLGLFVSYVTGPLEPVDVDPKLIVPVFDVVFPLSSLPESTREKLRFGIDHTGKFDETNLRPELFYPTPSFLTDYGGVPETSTATVTAISTNSDPANNRIDIMPIANYQETAV